MRGPLLPPLCGFPCNLCLRHFCACSVYFVPLRVMCCLCIVAFRPSQTTLTHRLQEAVGRVQRLQAQCDAGAEGDLPHTETHMGQVLEQLEAHRYVYLYFVSLWSVL